MGTRWHVALLVALGLALVTADLMQSRAVDTGVDLRVHEAGPPGATVGQIPIKSGFTYRFNEPPKEFSLDPVTGVIKTETVLDRESVEKYAFVVLSSQPTYPIEVRITVLDVNDNYPEFPEPVIAVAFSESAAAGTRLLLDAATDRDIGQNGIANDYRIVDGDSEGKFRLNLTVNPSGQTSYLHLETTGKLDRETNDFYILNVSARDGGNPPKYGYLQVNVTILDVNDNPPIFDQSDFSVSLNESVPLGTTVLRVTATDSDLGENSKITYEVTDSEKQFAVDPESGVITTLQKLSCPKYCSNTTCNMTCVLTVIARDHGVPRQDARTYVTVNLIDANDHDPVITFTYVPSTANFATVDENAKNHSLVAAITVTDLDAGLNGITSVSIVSGNELNHFRLENSSSVYIVHVNGVLDREEISKYNLTVVATDRGTPARTATAFLIIHVNDVNDHEPVFEKSEYSAVLSESAPPGTYIAGITATDEDTGVNADIYYDFYDGNQRQWFSIDHLTGLVTTRALLNREIEGTVELNVSARDGGPNPKWAFTRLKVTILDENDEAPTFSQSQYNVSLHENIKPIKDIVILTASDYDQGTNGSVSYFLQSIVERKYPNTFMLDPVTGQLSAIVELDREKTALYDIEILAKDQGFPPQSSTTNVFLNVLDVNDNDPVFYPQRYFETIKTDFPVGSTIVQVKAFDVDEGENARLAYKLENGGDGFFDVDSWTGNVILKKDISKSTKPTHILNISCKDKGNRRAYDDAVVEIVKVQHRSNIDFETYNGYSFKIVEDDGLNKPYIGRFIGKVGVRAMSESVSYFIVEGDSKKVFKIDERTGIISTDSNIDREEKMTYRLKIVAKNGLAYGFTIVNISILDVNDNYPIFIEDKDEILIPENMAVGQEIYFARATDRDSGANRTVSYALSYNPDNNFRISETTGVIYLNKPIRSEPGTSMSIEVVATDNGSPSLSTKHTVTAIIKDVNDHSPVFDHTSYETSLLESTSVNTRFFAISATDADLDINGKISYFIAEGNADLKFGIFPDGHLYVKSPLDREEKDYYSLTITARDHGKPSRSTQVPVVIHVLDENDNSPQFTNTTFVFRIRENEPPDTFVGKLTAIDRDIGRNAELTFSLPATQNDFRIDSRNGFIKTLRSFDRENLVHSTGQNYITLTVTVSDNGKVKLSDSVRVTVYVTDVNDNEPKFLRTPYKVEVSEGASVGASVMRVHSSDADEGLNGEIIYKLIGGDEYEKFSLDKSTGHLLINQPLDRETVDKYKLIVQAQDSGENPLSATTTVTVSVTDENDNAPVFTQSQLEVSVKETEPVNKKIMKFFATDADLGINKELQFSITSGNRKESFFIDSTSGELFLHKQLDYEDLTSYVLNITAMDNGSPSLSSTISLSVNVIDANDNAPVFTNTAIVRQIREGIPKHTPIVTVTAEDPDSGFNGKVYYSIKHQEPNDRKRHFAINNVTGVIHTLLPIDRESIDTFRITVVAYDRAEPATARLSAEKLVTVIVEDINDNAPVFVSMNAAVINAERMGRSATRHGMHIMNVLARDLDSGTNGLVTYKLINSGNDLFDLHRSNGALTLRYPPTAAEARWNLVIKATDEAVQSEQKTTETYLTVIMGGRDLQDLTWTNALSVSVAENEPAGTPVLNLTNNYKSGLEYYIVNVTGDGRQVDRLFDIDSGLGILSTAVMLDREAGVDRYEVEICAVSSGKPLQTSTTKVEVIILDKNDSPPEFKNIPPAYLASEDLAPGQPIATIKAEDPDTIGTIAYSIQSSDSPFTLDEKSGVLKLVEPLDREVVDSYQVLVRADDGVQFAEIVITVKVTDTNDNPPVFLESAYSFDISENAARGSIVGAVSASDPDFGPNAQLTYTVISDWANEVFSLNPQTGVFTLTAKLDYEAVPHYILVAQAQDNGHPSLSGTVTVYVNVVDLNDNAPQFDAVSYTNDVYENVSIGTSVVTIGATDLDSGLNGKLHYSISSGDEGQDFEIMHNGTIYTRNLLDRETIPVYSLIITAHDLAEPPEPQLSSTVQVTIQLRDVNDMAPEFITPNTTKITENIPLNTAIMTIKAVDKDEGRNGYVEYFIKPDTENSGFFSLGNVDGVLRATGKLDRELKAVYTVSILAKDRGDPPQIAETKLQITILDENDNSPVFDPKQYSASVPENASIGASVLQVSATDIDEGANGRVRYSIVSGDENRDFSISEDGGIIRVAKNLNYERKSRYILIVRAEDCAENEVRFDTAELSISIQDINDNPPTFLDSPYLAYVMENIIPPNGGYVITIEAYDADSPPFNNQVRYFIKEGDSDLFKINASSGEISLLRSLDREYQEEYTLSLVAMDTGSPPLTGAGIVKIIVQDVNDNSPEFERQSYKTHIKENLSSGTIILHSKATDKDIGNNAKIRYSLLGEKAERFIIDSATGVISTNASLDREESDIYYLILMAQDSATTDPKTATANLTIIVEDENDNTPTFSYSVYEAYIPEQNMVGDFVFGAKATDLDIGLNKKIVYDLEGEHQSLFEINKETGVIKVKENLSKYSLKTGSTYNLVMVATDSGNQPRRSTAELTLILKSVKNFPKFLVTNKLTFVFSEDTAEGVLVTRLSATSPKKGSVGLLQYAVAGGNVGDALRVEPMSGEVFITGKGLDYETMPLYEVWFEVRDSDNPPLKSFIEVEIKVTDANDNAPIVENILYNATVLEGESPPQLIAKIDAHDEDSNENGRITFDLVNNYDDTFSIDEESGEIYTNIALDRETIPFYEIIVEAKDHGIPALVGTSTVIVTVQDKNDNPPRFSRLFSVNVTENADFDSFVIRVTSSDLDIGSNANATYSFVENPDSKFTIDPISGNVTVAGPLDREQQDEYILKVAAIDGAWRSETPLTITIQDQNDNAPEFEYSFYSFNFPEMQKKNSYVGQVIATDKDKQGPNSIISYSLQQPSDLFTIDPATGELLSKMSMKYKRTFMESSPENMYSVIVLATDNGKPPMTSECLVTINVVDANNNAPKFENHEVLVPVPEMAIVGQKIIQVHAQDNFDFGINAEVEYYVYGGNGSAYFSINKANGWISLVKPFISLNQQYLVKIKAVDKGVPPQSDETIIIFVVTGDNIHSPKFTALSYQVIVPENEPVGSTILTVRASDDDIGPNGIIRYMISSGNEGNQFNINAITGAINILRPLDYDTIPEYRLNITARDLGFKALETTATLTIILTDINDNAPTFSEDIYVAYLSENSAINTFIFKVIATDIDSPKNAIIKYHIVGDSNQALFRINSDTGEIYSKQVFDYEERSSYRLEILAKNPGSFVSSTTNMTIQITGVNEYFPKFIQPVFHFDVSESADVGTNVGVIQATDQDSGDDGTVYYLFVGSSNDKGFSINSQTGVIRVSRYLDRETQNRVVLTVLAKNSGGIRGNDTDEAQVIISIQDGNDPPEFLRNNYETTVSEGASIGTEIIRVKAVDKDVRPQNNQFSYSLIRGNTGEHFKMDPHTGEIEVSRKLDRETSPTYNLIVGAIDTGIPPQTGTATVRVTLTDINDNGPILDLENFDGAIYENEPPNTKIATLTSNDPDLPPNGAPFSYAIIGGKHMSYVRVEKHTGVLLTTKRIDRELTPLLEINVQIEDSGSPIMKSNYSIKIKVLDRNDNPPTPRSAHVLVYTFNNKVPTGMIANVKPNDLDIVGDYKCKIIRESTSENTLEIMSIRKGCELYTNGVKPGQGYSFSVSGNDGIHRDVISSISIEFFTFNNETVEQSITLRIINMTSSVFLTRYYRSLIEILQNGLNNNENIYLYSINELEGSLDLTIAIKQPHNVKKKSVTEAYLKGKESDIRKLLKTQILLPYLPCLLHKCQNNGLCIDAIKVLDTSKITESTSLILSSPLITHDYKCHCADGFIGKNCDKRQDPCSPNPCQYGGQCRKQGYDFVCTCPSRRDGKMCELERGDVCSSSPCKNGGSCKESSDRNSFFCLCRPGYRGNQCEALVDSCRPNPCMNGGICISMKPGYKCSCTNGNYGKHCESSTFGFNELSYMKFPALDAATNDITLIFATTKPDSLLLYNYGAHTGGRSDFIAIELIGGKPVFSFGGARTSITSVTTEKNLADGNWYKLTATRNGRVISLSATSCTEHGDVCLDCKPGDHTCYADDTGQAGTLNFNNEKLLIGGLHQADPVLERPGQIHTDDFVGCMHSITVNGRLLNLTNPIKSRGVDPYCSRSENGACHKKDACNAGECLDKWKMSSCRCDNVIAPNCYQSLQSVSVLDNGYIQYLISEKHRRMQLLELFYGGTTVWDKRSFKLKSGLKHSNPPKSISFRFRTYKKDAILLYAATDKYYTLVELVGGKVSYTSKQNTIVNMTLFDQSDVSNGDWHNITLYSFGRSTRILVDGTHVGEELDAAGVHDFLDPYLTILSLGGIRSEWLSRSSYPNFEGCIANFTINNELQPVNGNGSIFSETIRKGKVIFGCQNAFGVGLAQNPDPLSIGVTLVIVFFIILIVAIFVSFVVFRVRKQQKEKNDISATKTNMIHSKQNGGSTIHNTPNLIAGTNDSIMNRHNDTNLNSYMSENADIMRNVGHIVGPELLSKKYKEREIMGLDPPRPQRPDIIEREVVGKSSPLREDPPPPPSTNTSHHTHDHPSGLDLNSEIPEHYDLENASSIAPSDIDVVFHYKGFREAGGVRKYKATPPPIASYHHKHQGPQHRLSPHHAAGYPPRVLPQSSQSSSGPRQLQNTPLARLSPSSELSQQPRILTLHDISGKPLQSALLATTSSSGGVSKDPLNSNSERSLNSPVMSQLSGQSSSAGRKTPSAPPQVPQVSVGASSVGLTAEEIERMNARQRTSSLVSTLDAVSSSSEAPRGVGVGHHMAHRHHSPQVDNRSSTGSDDESGNDSFTCSEIEYDNNSITADKSDDARRSNNVGNNPKTPIMPMPYESFDSSYRGSLSTLVASDDDLPPHARSTLYRQANGSPTDEWHYLIDWGPNFQSMIDVFKDIAELPDTVNGRMSSSLRLPNGTPKPSEEYV